MTFQFDFTEKIVFVAGATQGVGRAAAEAFHGLGATVVVHGPTHSLVARTIADLGGADRLIPAAAEDSSVAQIKNTARAVLDRLGGLDVLVNAPYGVGDCNVDDITEDYWGAALATNLKRSFFFAQACLPALKRNKGAIINIASCLGLIGGPKGTIAQTASSHAILQMTRMMALELARDGVRVNTVVCGTGIDDDGERALAAHLTAVTPMDRSGTAIDSIGALLYLAAPFAGFTTGSTITADGGVTAGHYV